MKNHHWRGEEPDLDNYFGFVYLIVNKITGRRYIGKKQYYFTKKVKVKGRKNRKIYKKESDWKFYTGSCKELNKDIKEFGKDNFTFFILYQCKSKGGLHWCEINVQVHCNVLKEKDDNGERLYYNGMIAGIKFIPKDEYPEIAIRQTGEYNTIFKTIENGNHPTLGKGHTDETKAKMSKRSKEYWASLSQEDKEAWIEKATKHFKGTGNRTFRPWAYKEPGMPWVEVHDKTIIDWCNENGHPKVKISSFKPPRRKNAYWAGWEFKILEKINELS